MAQERDCTGPGNWHEGERCVSVEQALLLCFYHRIPEGYIKQSGADHYFWQKKDGKWTFVSCSAFMKMVVIWTDVEIEGVPIPPHVIYQIEAENSHPQNWVQYEYGGQPSSIFNETAILL